MAKGERQKAKGERRRAKGTVRCHLFSLYHSSVCLIPSSRGME